MRRERWLLIGLLALALSPLPLFWVLGERSLRALETADLVLRGQQAELELLGALRVAAGEVGGAELSLEEPSRTAVLPNPDGAFLTHRGLVAARGAFRGGDPVAALEALDALMTGAAGPDVEAAARLFAAEVLDESGDSTRGRRMRRTAAALADDVERAAVSRWIKLAAAGSVDDVAVSTWLDEVSGRETNLEELVLLRRLCASAPERVARVERRARWPDWLAAVRERRRTLEPEGLAILETTYGWFVVDGDRCRAYPAFEATLAASSPGGATVRLVVLKESSAAAGRSQVLSGVVTANGLLLDLGASAVALDLPPPRLFGVESPRAILAGAVAAWGLLALALVLAVWRQQKRAHELVAAREDLIAQVAHELRTPLTVLRMYGESLVEGRVPAVRRDQYLRTIANEAERLGTLVDRVAQAARADDDPATTSRDPNASVDVTEVVRGLSEPFASAAEDAGGSLELDELPARAVARIAADELRLVLDVLFENALHHGGAPPRIHVGIERENGVVRCLIEDEGPGIANEDPERLFERWARGKGARGRGVGMGLFLARRAARASGGDVTLGSGASGGARATVTLPSASPSTSEEGS